MILDSLELSHFRNYKKARYVFSEKLTIVLGPNAIGKSNLIEAIFLLATGKSFRAEHDEELVFFGESITRLKGNITNSEEDTLEILIAKPSLETGNRFTKRYFVNGVPKRQLDFAGKLKVLLFVPSDLDIIEGPPSLRRRFLDLVLEQTDYEYKRALISYGKALRQRNALLEQARETGIRNDEQFSYWDGLLIGYGQTLTEKRKALIIFINKTDKTLVNCELTYDSSTISEERLLQYRHAEIGAGVTLVGPHRDDLKIYIKPHKEAREARLFASRGQQRLIVLQLKLLERLYMEQMLKEKPLLLLDDIFSELDSSHIKHVLSILDGQQTILSTTHEEFLGNKKKNAAIIELGKK